MSDCCEINKHSNDFRNRLKSAGFSATSTKLKLIELFYKTKSPLSSHDLIKQMRNVDESTIFRNLKQFTEAGLLSEINLDEGFKRYELAPDDHHHHHIKCNQCGVIETIDLCELKTFTKQLKSLGYTNISHKIEFFGSCSTCS